MQNVPVDYDCANTCFSFVLLLSRARTGKDTWTRWLKKPADDALQQNFPNLFALHCSEHIKPPRASQVRPHVYHLGLDPANYLNCKVSIENYLNPMPRNYLIHANKSNGISQANHIARLVPLITTSCKS